MATVEDKECTIKEYEKAENELKIFREGRY